MPHFEIELLKTVISKFTLKNQITRIHPLLPNAGRVWLDIGCGYGHLAPVIKQINYTYVGRDLSPHKVAAANDTYPNYDIAIGSLDDALSEGEFDVISAITVIDEIDNKSKFLNACRDHLCREGVLLMAVRNRTRFFSRKPVINEATQETTYDLNLDEWIAVLGEARFSILQITPFVRFVTPGLQFKSWIVWLKNLLINCSTGLLPLRQQYMLLFVCTKTLDESDQP